MNFDHFEIHEVLSMCNSIDDNGHKLDFLKIIIEKLKAEDYASLNNELLQKVKLIYDQVYGENLINFFKAFYPSRGTTARRVGPPSDGGGSDNQANGVQPLKQDGAAGNSSLSRVQQRVIIDDDGDDESQSSTSNSKRYRTTATYGAEEHDINTFSGSSSNFGDI